ncbi:hypothetical protein OESDEN_02757 [Oesophagostomum dentatum]|uniref:Uncharacterized protein n=1 Tax=Oesophagostomum dentatum TaxID=61180 RepID=A0A0B1TN67_OESDE|nr:hypothetical protein OESDEN_02757 [Oesophagostomum dentatum]
MTIIFIAIASVLIFALLIGAVKMMAGLIMAYLIINLLLKMPLFVVIYFTTYTLASYDYGDQDFFSSCGYQCSLYTLSPGFLWSGLIVSFLCCIFDGILTGGLRKLRLLCQGISTVM